MKDIQPAFTGSAQNGVGPLAGRQLVTEWEFIGIKDFKKIFSVKAGKNWPQVERLFKDYGPVLSVPFVSAVMYAYEDGPKKFAWCLNLLEEHFKKDLQYQHPELRGRLIIGDNPGNRSYLFLEQEIIRVLRPSFFK